MASLFSKIVNGEIPAFKVAENDDYLAFLDVYPLAKGHVLVIPKMEVDYLFDMEQKPYGELFEFARGVAIAVKQVVPCVKVGVAVIGLEVAHAHIHLVPMQTVSDINFSRPKLKFPEEEMQRVADAIATAYKHL